MEENKINEIVDRIKYDSDEVKVGILGVGYLSNFIINADLSNTILVLTDKRLYQKGVSYEKSFNNSFSKIKTQKVIEVKDITGTSMINFNPLETRVKILAGFFLCIFNTLGWGFLYFEKGYNDGFLISLLFAVGAGVLYYYYKNIQKKFFIVEYAGGSIITNSSDYSFSEIEDFQKSVYKVKSDSQK